ncbi:MAG: aminotransferase class IV [Gracilimonas sp.]|nr:aminotransferase class IV [Gracilimonas sp.]
MNIESTMILNGEFIAEAEAKVSPANRGLMYGDGCFETMRLYQGAFLEWHKHIDRLKAGFNYLGLDFSFDDKVLKNSIVKLAEMNHLLDKDAMIRMQFWRGGERGYMTTSDQVHWMVQISDISLESDYINLIVADTRCIPSIALDRKYKLSNGLNYVIAAQEARKKEVNDALMLTTDMKISETTSANIFWVRDNTVFTPDVNCDLLPGVTRDLILKICEENLIPFKEGEFFLDEILKADAVFCTNSLIEIQPVISIDSTNFNINHILVQDLISHFEKFRLEHVG